MDALKIYNRFFLFPSEMWSSWMALNDNFCFDKEIEKKKKTGGQDTKVTL